MRFPPRLVGWALPLLSFCITNHALAGPFDVQESDVRGVWKSETDEVIGIGRALWQAGQRDKAEGKFNEAWAKARTPADKVMVGQVLADFYMSGSKAASAIKIYEILLADQSLADDSASLSRLYDGLGRIYHSERQYVKAIKSYRTAEGFLPAIADSVSLASLYSDMASTLLEAGDLEEALSLARRAGALTPRADVVGRIAILRTEARIDAKFSDYKAAYDKMVESASLSGAAWDSEISFILNSATLARIGQVDRPKDDMATDIASMRSAMEQSDSMRRTAYAAALVVGLLCLASLIFLYLAFTRLRYYRERSHRLGSKLSDAQRVISIIAHDSNNQFNALLGMTGILAERGKTQGGEVEQLSRHIFSSAQLLYQMMNNLLTWSKSKELLNPKQQVISLADCVRCCVSSVQLMAKDKDVEISCDEVPPGIKVLVDFSHLEIILRNLISNAVKFTPRGGHVVIKAAAYSKHVALSVDDDGCGMSQDDVSRFNKELDLVPNAGTNNEMGNGIGLAICRDLVRNNGGSIVIEPGRKCGTSVTVLLNTV